MKSLAKICLIFLSGVFVGGFILAVLSSHASKTFLVTVKLNYELQQELEGYKALQQENYDSAVTHFTNLANSQEGGNILAFEETHSQWPINFPFVAPILKKIGEVDDPQKLGQKRLASLSRGLVALAYERQGEATKADLAYQKVISSLGVEGLDVTRFKKLVEVNIASYNQDLIQNLLDSLGSE